MSAISDAIVREYFEQRGFLVRQQRKHVGPVLREEEEIDFYVLNPQPQPGSGALPFILGAEDLPRLERAVVVVAGRHTRTVTPATLEWQPEILRFAEAAAFKQAARYFGGAANISRILVAPSLQHEAQKWQQTVDYLKTKGVDAIIPFRTLLAGLIDMAEANRNYQKSDVLQLLRLLKVYAFIKEPQMELFKSRARRAARRPKQPPAPDTVPGAATPAAAS